MFIPQRARCIFLLKTYDIWFIMNFKTIENINIWKMYKRLEMKVTKFDDFVENDMFMLERLLH